MINDQMRKYIYQAIDERLDKQQNPKWDDKYKKVVKAAYLKGVEIWKGDLLRALELACADLEQP